MYLYPMTARQIDGIKGLFFGQAIGDALGLYLLLGKVTEGRIIVDGESFGEVGK